LPAVSIADMGMTIEELRGQPLDLIAREGAQMILEAALEEEIVVALERERYQRRADAPPGYRNGTRQRKLLCGSGEIIVRKPKIVGAQEPF
jgi:putative transposase